MGKYCLSFPCQKLCHFFLTWLICCQTWPALTPEGYSWAARQKHVSVSKPNNCICAHQESISQAEKSNSLILSVSYPSILTKAGMPPDLKIARRPSRWWERLCKVPAEQRAVSTSPEFCMARTTAETICGERIRAWREASFFDNWCTITAALFTTT